MRPLLYLIACFLLALPAGAQRSRALERDLPALRKKSVEAAAAMIEKNRKDLERIQRRLDAKRGLPGDPDDRDRLMMINEYCKLHRQKQELYNEIQQLDERLLEKRRTDQAISDNDLEKQRRLNLDYEEVMARRSNLKSEYKARFGQAIFDPLQYILNRYLKSDPMAKEEASR